MTRFVYLQAPAGGGGRSASGSGVFGQSVSGAAGRKLKAPPLYPPAVQVRRARTLASFSDRIAVGCSELTWTEQSPAEIFAELSRRMVSGAASSRPITQTRVLPAIIAVADTSRSVSSGVTIRLMIAALRWDRLTFTPSVRAVCAFSASFRRALISFALTVTMSSPRLILNVAATTPSATAWTRSSLAVATFSSRAAARAAASAAFCRAAP
jgi:hypothetical protein